MFTADANSLLFNRAITSSIVDGFNIASAISSMEASIRNSQQSALIVDFDEHRILFRTKHLLYLDEITSRDLKRICDNPYWSLISDETLSKFLKVRNSFLTLKPTLSTQDYSQFVCVIDFPISVKGHELFVNQKFTPLYIRHDGIVRIGLFTMNYSTKKDFECAINTPNARRYIYNLSTDRFTEININSTLTQTEKTILLRTKMGMSNKEIAETLYISIHTVKTHKSNIYKKLNVSNIVEALTLVDNYHLFDKI